MLFRLDGQALEWCVSEILDDVSRRWVQVNITYLDVMLHGLSVWSHKSNPSFRQRHVHRVVWVTVLRRFFMRPIVVSQHSYLGVFRDHLNMLRIHLGMVLCKDSYCQAQRQSNRLDYGSHLASPWSVYPRDNIGGHIGRVGI